MLAAGVDNKPVLFHCILVNPISIIRQPGPLVKNQRWNSCCCSSWCFYALAWYRHASLLRRHCMTITLRVGGGKGGGRGQLLLLLLLVLLQHHYYS